MIQSISNTCHTILNYLSHNNKNACELLFFITITYYIIKWLSADQSKKLTHYWYGYMFTALIAYLMKLDTITHFLYLTFPATTTIFILMHQQTLQRNMIALKRRIYVPENNTNHHWIDTLLRSALVRMHQKIALHILIERTDIMTDYLNIQFPLQTPFTQSIAELMDTSQTIHPHQMIICNKQGLLYGANAIWHHHISGITNTQNHWPELDTYYTSNTDAIIMYTDHTTGTFNLILNGHLIEHLSTNQIRTLLIQLTSGNTPLSYEQLTSKDHYYVTNEKKTKSSEKNS